MHNWINDYDRTMKCQQSQPPSLQWQHLYYCTGELVADIYDASSGISEIEDTTTLCKTYTEVGLYDLFTVL